MVYKTRYYTLSTFALGTAIATPTLSLIANYAREPKHITQEHDQEEQKRALSLNILLEKQLEQLDILDSILQYLGQALNKGTLKLSSDQQNNITKWILDHQRKIRQLAQQPTYPLYEPQIYNFTVAVKLLTIHIKKTIESKFITLEPFTIDKAFITHRRSVASLETIQELTEKNNELLSGVKKSAENLGLTRINKIARAVDAFNDKWRITHKLSYAPFALLTGIAAIHVMPEKWFPLGRLSNMKNWISSSEDESADNQTHEKGWFTRLINFMGDKKTKTIGSLLGIAGGWKSIKSELPDVLKSRVDRINQGLHNKWQELKGFSPTYSNNSYRYESDITLDDERLVGLEAQIEQLRPVVRYITDPEIYDRSNAHLEKGILLVGPSRCGKTYAARALHGSINQALAEKGSNVKFGFKEIKWQDISWTEEGIKTVLQDAKKNAPCVLFIDELHNFSLQPKEGSGKTINEFLTGMSGLSSESDTKGQVIFMAATNHPELLDSALLQPGRFGTIIHFEKPHFEQRKKYFNIMFKHNAIDTSNLDIDALARQTENCSYGDLEFIVKQARFTARSHARSVTQQHLQDQIYNHVYKFKSELALTDQEKKALIAHQAGHALACVLLEPQTQLEFVTILPRHRKIKEQRIWQEKEQLHTNKNPIKYGGLFTYNTAQALQLQTQQELKKQCMIALSGRLAEKVLLGSAQSGHHPHDKQKALGYAHKIVLKGHKLESLSNTAQEQKKQQAEELLKKIKQEAYTILQEHKQLLQAIAHALETYSTLSAQDIKLIIQDTRHMSSQ
jgi:ATP-dependent Zn protease